jgi:hypothetical protein
MVTGRFCPEAAHCSARSCEGRGAMDVSYDVARPKHREAQTSHAATTLSRGVNGCGLAPGQDWLKRGAYTSKCRAFATAVLS